jgi:acetyltransferase-like isoleucine patch superfamily enzyme
MTETNGYTSGYARMRASEPYTAPDRYLIELQMVARQKLDAINTIPSFDLEHRNVLLTEQLGSFGASFIVSPVTWEYGKHIHIGSGVFINFDCIFLDGADITIGDGTAIGPRVQLLTAGHPVDAGERVTRDFVTGQRNGAVCINKPISIGKDCWIGAGAIILGGVTVGDGTTIGAGSLVTRDIPAGVVAAGNPCRIIHMATCGPQAANAA